MIDLRSDTVTLPSKEMLETILSAKLGDDVWREDETVQELESFAADLFGKEAGLLVTSGTQGNLVAELTHLKRGDGIILEQESHIYMYEVGGLTALVGAYPFLVPGEQGVMNPKDIESILSRPKNIHFPEAKLVCIENTHNRGGGKIIPTKNVEEICKIAHDYDAKVHMDGARIFNASVALKKPVSELVKNVDSIQFCLSKGLACPIGSVLVGDEEFIEKARKNRKMVGGGMRQAGIIAAPGLYALKNMIDRLEEDHAHAKILEKELAKFDHLIVKPVETNIVIVDLRNTSWNAEQISHKLEEKGILVTVMGPKLIRFVTHYGITYADIEKAVETINAIFD
ncbi:MAG: threonine aldolase family protein [Candidatus Heimdallarchaeaceae archaeon]